MDYTLNMVGSRGGATRHNCATLTEVENYIMAALRVTNGLDCSDVAMTFHVSYNHKINPTNAN